MVGSSIRTVIQKKHQNQHKNVSMSTKWYLAIPVLWPEPNRKWVGWTEEKSCESEGSGEILSEGMVLISYQVFSKLFRHYRRQLRAGKGCCNNRVPIIVANMIYRKHLFYIEISPHFQLFYFNDSLEFFLMINQKDKKYRLIFPTAFIQLYQGCQY